MKYGLVSYSNRPMRPNGINRVNLGDPIQSYAMQYIYEQMGIHKSELIQVSRYEAGDYDGEYVILPFNCFNRIFNQLGHPYRTLPLSSKIIPVFISFHLHSRVINEDIIENLKLFQPIGCRDEETMINLREHGILAYLSGCVTSLLPRRTNKPKHPKTFFIDVPESLMSYVPKHLLENAEFVTHHAILPRTSETDVMSDEECNTFYEMSMQQYETYKNEATLIVTSRLHAASPCMAMGIPVILVSESFDGRFSWLDKFLPLYTPELFGTIDWNPAPIDYENEKISITKMYMEQIANTYNKYNSVFTVSSFFENREKSRYNNEILNALKALPISNQLTIRYAVWGLTTQALKIVNVIKDNFPSWELTAAIDTTCNGDFEGVPVYLPSDIESLPQDVIIFIVPASAHKTGGELLKKQNRNYVVVKNNTMLFD